MIIVNNISKNFVLSTSIKKILEILKILEIRNIYFSY